MCNDGNDNPSEVGRIVERHMPEIRRAILVDELLTEVLTDRTATRVTEKIIERENRRQRVWTLIVAILATAGVAGVTAVIDNLVNDALTSDTSKLILEDISRKQLDKEVPDYPRI